MSLVSTFTKGLKGLKLKEVGPYSAQYAREHLTYSKLQPRFKTSLDVSLITLHILPSYAVYSLRAFFLFSLPLRLTLKSPL